MKISFSVRMNLCIFLLNFFIFATNGKYEFEESKHKWSSDQTFFNGVFKESIDKIKDRL